MFEIIVMLHLLALLVTYMIHCVVSMLLFCYVLPYGCYRFFFLFFIVSVQDTFLCGGGTFLCGGGVLCVLWRCVVLCELLLAVVVVCCCCCCCILSFLCVVVFSREKVLPSSCSKNVFSAQSVQRIKRSVFSFFSRETAAERDRSSWHHFAVSAAVLLYRTVRPTAAIGS